MIKGNPLFFLLVSFFATLMVLLTTLRVCGIVSVSFVWIFSPIWVPISFIMLICMLFGGLLVLPFLWDFIFKRKDESHSQDI
jgi:hypothetical protein